MHELVKHECVCECTKNVRRITIQKTDGPLIGQFVDGVLVASRETLDALLSPLLFVERTSELDRAVCDECVSQRQDHGQVVARDAANHVDIDHILVQALRTDPGIEDGVNDRTGDAPHDAPWLLQKDLSFHLVDLDHQFVDDVVGVRRRGSKAADSSVAADTWRSHSVGDHFVKLLLSFLVVHVLNARKVRYSV